MSELTVKADANKLNEVLDFVDEQLDQAGCELKIKLKIDIAVEELFVNIANYAYKGIVGNATICMDITPDPLKATITFIDNGTPFNPLKKPDPDITLIAEKRAIGGLGIYMVKKSMDEVLYEYAGGENRLTIKKKLLA